MGKCATWPWGLAGSLIIHPGGARGLSFSSFFPWWVQHCTTTWIFQWHYPQKPCCGHILLNTENKTVTCPDSQYVLFSSRWCRDWFWLYITKYKPGTLQEHKLPLLMTVLVCEKVNGMYKEVKYILPAWPNYSLICVGLQKSVSTFPWDQQLDCSLPVFTWLTHVLKWLCHYHAWVLCNRWVLVPPSPYYPYHPSLHKVNDLSKIPLEV